MGENNKDGTITSETPTKIPAPEIIFEIEKRLAGNIGIQKLEGTTPTPLQQH